MHYMIDPRSDRILRPSLHVMDCELCDWACSFYMKMLTDFGYPKYMILQTLARFELDICGQTGRKLWITIYDEVSGHGFAEEQSDLFLEAFIEEFRVPFWNLIPATSVQKGTVLSARVLRTSPLTSTSRGASGMVVGFRE